MLPTHNANEGLNVRSKMHVKIYLSRRCNTCRAATYPSWNVGDQAARIGVLQNPLSQGRTIELLLLQNPSWAVYSLAFLNPASAFPLKREVNTKY